MVSTYLPGFVCVRAAEIFCLIGECDRIMAAEQQDRTGVQTIVL